MRLYIIDMYSLVWIILFSEWISLEKKTKKTWKSDPQEPKEEPNPDADTDVDDSSSDEEEKNVKHDPDKVIKTEDGDIKQDPDQPAKLETGQRENETLAEFKLRWVDF